MNRTKLKTYAPQARRDFIQAVTDRAAFYGLTDKKIEPITENGDVAIIAGRAFPRSIATKRKALEERITQYGFAQTMEAMAYTWFNRLVAIRYMELHGYLDHGYRVLSHPDTSKSIPEILEHAEHVDLPGLDKSEVIELKLEGSKEAELYRMLLLAQCNALHRAMPFLFERIEDKTELLLPGNLLHSDSLIRKLVSEIDEEDWQEVEIIGWLYQFYISEKKKEVIGKVVASEDIPAATQLFTPSWIVKYLVQNTLGRQWLATYPHSALRQQMQYYIEPAEQTPEVLEQLKAITPTNLNPEELTLLDPACGSGHILVEAYNLFQAIYQERGYRAKDIPALILQKNLFGLEIDDRAAQLAAFALMMKARADDRRIFDSEAKPNILAFEDSQGMNAADITHALNSPIPSQGEGQVSQGDIASLLDLFENAKTFGSLIQVPLKLAEKLPEIEQRLNDVLKQGDLTHASAQVIKPLLQQAQLLAGKYDAVVANPPYLGRKSMNSQIKDLADAHYSENKSDLFAMFTERILVFGTQRGRIGLMTPFVWMFLQTYETLRVFLTQKKSIVSLVQPQYHTFFESAAVPICTFIIDNSGLETKGTYFDLTAEYGADIQPIRLKQAIDDSSASWRYVVDCRDFSKVPTSPIAYWTTSRMRDEIHRSFKVSDYAVTRQGLITGNNDRFLRLWHEVSFESIGFNCASRAESQQFGKTWFPCVKGGPFRKWYGNMFHVVNWKDDGKAIRSYTDDNGRLLSRPQNLDYYFREGLSWSTLTIGTFSMRWCPPGMIFESKGSMCFPKDPKHTMYLLGFFNTKLVNVFLKATSPTLDYHEGPVSQLAFRLHDTEAASKLAKVAIDLSKIDWDAHEISWDFETHPVIQHKALTLQHSAEAAEAECLVRCVRLKTVEEEINQVFIEAFGLQDELSPEVPEDQITLYCPEREKDIKRLLSYAIGCMMGRYSLDKQGLIYAHSGKQSFDHSQYKTFRADEDGIIPLLESDWDIRHDGTNRVVEFIGVAWPKEHLEANLKFIADSIGPTNNEQPQHTIRRYLATGFYKHHLWMYKKRPIYWLFSSGKQRAFQCLVYLHRYHAGTLARMRTEYVIPLQGQFTARIEQLASDIQKASSTSHRKKLEKERDRLLKQQTELRAFDEKLRHYADQRITLNLDDGVKVNYGKFGDLLAEVKAVTGGTDEE